MVLTAAQTTTFFEHAKQMGIPHTTVMQLQSEGITLVTDFADFDKDSLQHLSDNSRYPGGHVPDPNPGAPPGSTIPTPPFVFGAKSQNESPSHVIWLSTTQQSVMILQWPTFSGAPL